MDKIETMKRFIAVAQTGSFTQASNQLGVPKSAISMSVSRLEEHLQTRLLRRSTRQVSLTEAGERYLSQSQRLIDELEGLENQFQRESNELSGVIKVDMPSRFFSTVVAPNLHQWFELHPKTQLRLVGADYRIDLIKERIDCVIRGGVLEDSNLIARHLGDIEMINCVSPSYVERYGLPTQLNQLDQHFVVDYAPEQGALQSGFEYVKNNKTHFVSTKSLISVSTTDAYLSACLNGLGIIQLPKWGVQEQIARGELIEVLSDYVCMPMTMSVLYESRHQQPRRIREFIDWLSHLFARFSNNQPDTKL
ncbi:LysR family transcriptional regulator [Vibrio diazotrophicus]|uniref:LysR family transcriptional regulator n=1 Tax=Vibrio diazotrophicus TaxID=685 RepID=UPI000C9E49BB|nr:LysR family transcriptional regulator [Vibrio diazotrophicus]PNH92137.1 LysR family transcriptional regulator [Vibrio diazotrophicus]